MAKLVCFCLTLLLFIVASADSDSEPSFADRSMAVTIDDLPLNSLNREISYQTEITQKILSALSAHKVPAVGFVNENKLYDNGKPVPARVNLLRMWLDADMTLGNHTYSHPDFHSTDFTQFRRDIETGEDITRKLLSEKNEKLRYFRHPFLHVGNTSEKKRELENYLKDRNYVTAPVTIDNSEWIFARAYEKALLDNDTSMMSKVGKAYIDYMEAKAGYYEEQSRRFFNREIGQILLIHANALNGDYLDELILMLKQRSYRFKSLADILEDPAYQSPDSYTGEGGISWIHRWAITKGKTGSFFAGEPPTPEFVMNYSGLFRE